MKIDKNALFQKAFLVVGTILFVLNLPPLIVAQEQKTNALDSNLSKTENVEPIVVNTNLVTFNVSVSNIDGAAVTGLNKNDFNIFDNKILQEIIFFSDIDAPASISVVLDTSASMSGNKIIQAKEALANFIQTSKSEDEFFLIDFGSRPNLLLNGTRAGDSVLEKFTYLQPKGNTALYDAINLGLERVRRGSHSKKIILLISDGEDNNSRFSFRDLKKQLKESDAIIYTIGIGNSYKLIGKGLNGKDILKELSAFSNGKSFFPKTSNDMCEVFEQISLEIRHLYSIGYYPSEQSSNGKKHQVTVKVIATDETPRLFVRSHKAYIAGATP